MGYFQGIDSLQRRVKNALMKLKNPVNYYTKGSACKKEIKAPSIRIKVKNKNYHVRKAEKRLFDTSEI